MDYNFKNLKRDNWTNEEVIALLEGCKLPVIPNEPEDGLSLYMAICLFKDMKCDSEKYAGAKALDLDTGRVICVGPKLPQ